MEQLPTTLIALLDEGIECPSDLVELYDDDLKTAASNLRKPSSIPSQIQRQEKEMTTHCTFQGLYNMFREQKSSKRLKIAAVAVHYHKVIVQLH